MIDFDTIVATRRSVRQYLSTPVPNDVLDRVLAAAQLTPSNCNTQPWQIHLLSGEMRNEFSRVILDAFEAEYDTKDFSFSVADYEPASRARAQAQGASYHQALGVSREDVEKRRATTRRNLTFFDAPHVALLFVPAVGDNVRVAADLGMWAQTFLLSLVANGLDGIPQTQLGSYAEQARELLGLPDDLKLLFGISFGYADVEAPAARYKIGRIPVNDSVFHHSTRACPASPTRPSE